jgi:hypothetical protein
LTYTPAPAPAVALEKKWEGNNWDYERWRSSGSPVDTSDPRPFANMSMAITRRVPLADDGHPDEIRNTAVLESWFMGKRVYVSNVRKTNAKRG